MGVLGFKRLALAVAASIIFALFAAQFAQLLAPPNMSSAAAAVGTGLLDTAIPGNAHKSTAFNSAFAASVTPGATAWPICCARDHKCCHRAQEAEFE
ncbi:hypothetical protein NL676_019292 [Syzygium grande]|nr:hypothetical protein NL676_019292 [Syzygium grande]